jgi:hypothetical protein
VAVRRLYQVKNAAQLKSAGTAALHNLCEMLARTDEHSTNSEDFAKALAETFQKELAC